jgi:hypothetical protein
MGRAHPGQRHQGGVNATVPSSRRMGRATAKPIMAYRCGSQPCGSQPLARCRKTV